MGASKTMVGALGAWVGLALSLALSSLAAAPAAAQAIATAVDVRPEATGQYNGTDVVLSAEDDLFQGQTVTTGPVGQVQIVFADETHMVVGPSSSLVIETYLMRNGGTASEFAVSALGGTFRFISGESDKSAYRIDTPTGTIGVRGTEFDFTVDNITKKTSIVLFEGQVIYCPTNGECQTISDTCEIGVGGSANTELIGAGSSGYPSSASNFLYVNSQRTLNSAFKVDTADECDAIGSRSTPADSGTSQGGPNSGDPEPDPEPEPEPEPNKPPGSPDPVPDPLPDPLPDSQLTP